MAANCYKSGLEWSINWVFDLIVRSLGFFVHQLKRNWGRFTMQQRQRQKGRKNIMSCNNNNVVVRQHDVAGKDFRPCVSCTNQCYKLHGEIHKKAVQRRLEKQQLDQQQLKKYNNCSSNNSGGNITDHHLQQGLSTSSCCSDQREVMINNEPYFVKPMIKGCLAYAQRSWMVQ